MGGWEAILLDSVKMISEDASVALVIGIEYISGGRTTCDF